MGSEDFGTQKGNIDELYSGRKSIPLKAAVLKKFEKERFVGLGELGEEPYPNEYLTLIDELNPNYRSYGRYSKKKGVWFRLYIGEKGFGGFTQRIWSKNLPLMLF